MRCCMACVAVFCCIRVCASVQQMCLCVWFVIRLCDALVCVVCLLCLCGLGG